MVYDESTGKYAFNQYGKVMTDLKTEEVEAFRNVIVMYADITTTGIYHIADFNAGGKGYFACGGKLIPIVWMCGGDKEPFRFFTESGEPLELGRGNHLHGHLHASVPRRLRRNAGAARRNHGRVLSLGRIFREMKSARSVTRRALLRE